MSLLILCVLKFQSRQNNCVTDWLLIFRKISNSFEDFPVLMVDLATFFEGEPLSNIRTTDESQNFICLCKSGEKWKLTPGANFKTQRNLALPQRNQVFVISVLGNTAAGKSFLIRSLLPESNGDMNIPMVQEDGTTDPTSADIKCFSTSLITSESVSTLLLDYEGEEGNKHPREKLQYAIIQNHDSDNQSSNEDVIERAAKVADLFPKLAYALSNVVILMSREDFGSDSYLKRCKKLAERSTALHNVHSKPVLVCINNYARLVSDFNVEQITADFKKQQDFNNLREYFSDVVCFRLPDRDIQRSYPKTGKVLKGDDIFKEQITKLKEYLVKLYNNYRDALPTCNYWLSVTESLLDVMSISEETDVSEFWNQLLISVNDEIFTPIISLFHKLYYHKDKIHSTDWFQACRRFAMKLLARSLVFKSLKLFESNKKSTDICNLCKFALERLWWFLDPYQPCQAPYLGAGFAKDKDHIIFCYERKGNHTDHHVTSEAVYFNSDWISQILPGSQHEKWEGTFYISDQIVSEPSSDMHMIFLDDVDKARTIETTDVCETFLQLLHEYGLTDIIQHPSGISVGFSRCCLCCLKDNQSLVNATDPTVSGLFCPECLLKLQQLDPAMARKRLFRCPSSNKQEKCAMCLVGERNFALYPCGHYGFCDKCCSKIQSKLMTCPVCKTKLTECVKVCNSLYRHDEDILPLPALYRTTALLGLSKNSLATNENYLLVNGRYEICLIDEQLNVVRRINIKVTITDMCWSSALKQFIIISPKDVFSLEEKSMEMKSCEIPSENEWKCGTCSNTKLFVSTTTKEHSWCIHEFYLHPSITFSRKLYSPDTLKNEEIQSLKFNDDFLAILTREKNSINSRLELWSLHAFQCHRSVDVNSGLNCCMLKRNEWMVVDDKNCQLLHISADGKVLRTSTYRSKPKNISLFKNTLLLVRTEYSVDLFKLYEYQH